MKLKTYASAASLTAVALLTAAKVQADTLVDRGLPTANLNNAAGSSRANVAWADAETSATPSDPWYVGDDFKIGGAGNYHITDIRTWVVGDNLTGLSLKGGVDGTTYGTISSAYTVSSATYAGGASYQGAGGSSLDIHQVDFTVDLTVSGSSLYDFFVANSTFLPYSADLFVGPFVSASNAGLGGAPADGADNEYKFLDGSSVITEDSATDGTWDKGSDINVQVLGTSVPDAASTLGLASACFGAMALIRRKLV